MTCDGSGKIPDFDNLDYMPDGVPYKDCPGCEKCKPCPKCGGNNRDTGEGR
jgi:hypothetical protein